MICKPRRTPPDCGVGAWGVRRTSAAYGRAPLRRSRGASPRLRRPGVERRCCAPLEAGRRRWRSPRRGRRGGTLCGDSQSGAHTRDCGVGAWRSRTCGDLQTGAHTPDCVGACGEPRLRICGDLQSEAHPPPTAASERSGACGEPRLPYGRAPLRRSPRLRRRGVERRCCAPLEAGRRPWRSPRRVDWADAATRPVPAYEGEPRSREADHGSGAKPHCPRPGSSVYQELQLSRGGGYPPLKGHRRQKLFLLRGRDVPLRRSPLNTRQLRPTRRSDELGSKRAAGPRTPLRPVVAGHLARMPAKFG